jgi:transposase-like protein
MKQRKSFSESVKRENVRKIEQGILSRSQVSKLYGISTTSVTRWVKKYGVLPPTEKVVIESESDYLELINQKKKVEELEKRLGRLYVQNVYLQEVIKSASEDLSMDIEKKYSTK